MLSYSELHQSHERALHPAHILLQQQVSLRPLRYPTGTALAPTHISRQFYFNAVISKAKRDFGYAATVSVKQGIDMVVKVLTSGLRWRWLLGSIFVALSGN
jgi:hypothetical protein